MEGTIPRLDPTGAKAEVFACGIRNSVGMNFHPGSGELYFTDIGADDMDDGIPRRA
jgi:glucose/arabinose dehydrogenase